MLSARYWTEARHPLVGGRGVGRLAGPVARHVVCHPFAVEVGQRGAQGSVVDQHPAPALIVGAVRRLEGEAETFLDHRALHRSLEVETAPNGPGGREHLIERQGGRSVGHANRECNGASTRQPFVNVPSPGPAVASR